LIHLCAEITGCLFWSKKIWRNFCSYRWRWTTDYFEYKVNTLN